MILRLRSDGTGLVPWRLQTAGFSLWQDGSWYAHRGEVRKIEGTADAWRLDSRPADGGGVVVEWVPALTEGLVPLPLATRIIRDLPAEEVDRTWLGTVHAEVQAGLVEYRAEFGTQGTWEGPPSEEDERGISPLEASAIEAVATELRLVGEPPREAMRRIEEHFRRHFRYTLELVQEGSTDPRATTALGRFLLGHRSGHCEYFATAAVLLLRAAGVPARYATGYAIRAEEREGDVYTVRASQAHAWARVWDDGNWVDFDPTPAAGFGVDGRVPGWRRRLSRMGYELWYAISRWWWLGEKRFLRQAYWLSVPLLAALLWRFRRLRVDADPLRGPLGTGGGARWPGLDSEWFVVDAELMRRGVARRHQESMASWRARLAAAGWDLGDLDLVTRTAGWHERLRFDPVGLGDDERGLLRQSAATLCTRLAKGPGAEAARWVNRGDAATRA